MHMAQTSILGRIGQLVRANVNAMLDQAEDPEKMLDQLIRDFTNNIAEAEEAVAQTVGNLRLLEDDAREAREASGEWLSKAKAASDRAEALRAAGNATEADRFDALAKLALRRELSFEDQLRTFDTQISQQTELTDKLKDGLNKLRLKREELVQKRDELVSRAKMAQAQMRSSIPPRSSTGSRSGSGARRRRPAGWRRSGWPRSRTSSPSSRAARTTWRSRRASSS
jgi:phage shock protein A